MRQIKTLSLVDDKFSSIRILRITSCNNHYYETIKNGKAIQPITVIRASKLNMDTPLYDVITGEQIKNKKEKILTWLVIDGAERLKQQMLYYAGTNDDRFANIDAIIEDVENIPGGNIIKYITDWQYMADGWSAREYVEKCLAISPTNPIFRMTLMLMNHAASISTVSRLAAANSNVLTPKALFNYLNGDMSVMSEVCYERALELYRLFLEVGFAQWFINQRYLIDYVNQQINKTGWLDTINKIATVNAMIVNSIQTMTPEEYAMGKILEIVDWHYSVCLKHCNDKTYKTDFSRERFEQNMLDIPRLLDK